MSSITSSLETAHRCWTSTSEPLRNCPSRQSVQRDADSPDRRPRNGIRSNRGFHYRTLFIGQKKSNAEVLFVAGFKDFTSRCNKATSRLDTQAWQGRQGFPFLDSSCILRVVGQVKTSTGCTLGPDERCYESSSNKLMSSLTRDVAFSFALAKLRYL